MGSVESVKAVSEIFCPVGGTVAEINDALEDAPEQVNSDPYGDGWLIRLRLDRSGIPGRDHALRGAVRAARRGRRLSGPGGGHIAGLVRVVSGRRD